MRKVKSKSGGAILPSYALQQVTSVTKDKKYESVPN